MGKANKQPEANQERGKKILACLAIGSLALLAGDVAFAAWGPQISEFVQNASIAAEDLRLAIVNFGPNTAELFHDFGEVIAANARELELLAAAGLVAIGGAASGYIGKKEN
jgi:hypothetical protein